MGLGAVLTIILTGPLGGETLRILVIACGVIVILLVLLYVCIQLAIKYLVERYKTVYTDNAANEHIADLTLWLVNPLKRQELLEKYEGRIGDIVRIGLAYFSGVRALGVIIALAAALVGLGSLLVAFMQAQLLVQQNAFIAFEQTTSFRELLYQPPLDSTGNQLLNYDANSDSIFLWPAPDMSIIGQIVYLAKDQQDVVVRALNPLVQDKASSISSGALLALKLIEDTLSIHLANLPKANLSRLPLYKINLPRSDLRQSDLTLATLSQSNLYGSNLSGANLFGTELINANLGLVLFSGANLYHANFTGADLTGADFTGADLTGADFTGAMIVDANFSGALVESAKGLSIDRLCRASDLRNIKPDSILIIVEDQCPEKLTPDYNLELQRLILSRQ